MSLWLILVIIAIATATVNVFVDNYISDVIFKDRLPECQKNFYAFAYFAIGLALVLGVVLAHDFAPLTLGSILAIVAAGTISSLSTIFYYKALGHDESTTVTILDQLSPVAVGLLSVVFLGETLSATDFLAFALIAAAPVILYLSSRKNSKKASRKTIIFMLCKILLGTISTLTIAKFANIDLSSMTTLGPVLTMLGFLCIGKGLGDFLPVAFNPEWRTRYSRVKSTTPAKKFYGLLSLDQIFWFIYDAAYYVAISIAPSVAVVSGILKISIPVSVLIAGVFLTLLWPSFGREHLTRRALRARILATLIAAAGVCLLQFA